MNLTFEDGRSVSLSGEKLVSVVIWARLELCSCLGTHHTVAPALNCALWKMTVSKRKDMSRGRKAAAAALYC